MDPVVILAMTVILMMVVVRERLVGAEETLMNRQPAKRARQKTRTVNCIFLLCISGRDLGDGCFGLES